MPWTAIGPSTQVYPPGFEQISVDGRVTGRVNALGFSQSSTGSVHLFLGSCGGGVWRTIGASLDPPPSWLLVTPDPNGVYDNNMASVPVANQAGINRIDSSAGSRPALGLRAGSL
jgi:hypothetical protein